MRELEHVAYFERDGLVKQVEEAMAHSLQLGYVATFRNRALSF